MPVARSTATRPPAFTASLLTPRRLESDRMHDIRRRAAGRKPVEGAHKGDRVGHAGVRRICRWR